MILKILAYPTENHLKKIKDRCHRMCLRYVKKDKPKNVRSEALCGVLNEAKDLKW